MRSPADKSWGDLMKRKCKVYDADKKLLLGEFEPMYDAAKFLGIPHNRIRGIITSKSINRTNKLGLRIAIR